jgi:hypothetical protein
MKDYCEKCKTKNTIWKSGETYKGLDEHHNPPKHMFEWIGDIWRGNIFTLCRECHTGKLGLHKIIIAPKLLSYVGIQRNYESEFWICKHMTPDAMRKARDEIFLLSKKWVENGDTKTTTN